MLRKCASLFGLGAIFSVVLSRIQDEPSNSKSKFPVGIQLSKVTSSLAALELKKLLYQIFPVVKASKADDDAMSSKVRTALDAFFMGFYKLPFINCENERKAKKEPEEKRTRVSKHRHSFRENTITRYENRLRHHSSPDKIFRYFATVRVRTGPGQYDICMTPQDFLRSIYPNIRQPEGLGLDQYRWYDPKRDLKQGLPKNSIFYKLSPTGLITYTDYVMLLSMISLPQRFFEIAFFMFDMNGDGQLCAEDFSSFTSMLNRNHFLRVDSSSLKPYFFGKNFDKKLTINEFIDFQKQLNHDVLWMEFDTYKNKNDVISEVDFASIVLAYAQLNERQKELRIQRVKTAFEQGEGISRTEYMNFFRFAHDIRIVDTALSFYYLAGVGIDRKTMKHVTKTVVGVELTDNVINVIFTIFDNDMDGHLSRTEFCATMRDRLFRRMHHDQKFLNLLGSFVKCAKETFF